MCQGAKPGQLLARPCQPFLPEVEVPDIEGQQELELLCKTADHRDHSQRKLEQPECKDPLRSHLEKGRAALFGNGWWNFGQGLRRILVASLPHDFPQPLPFRFGKIGKREVLLAASPGLELHCDEAEEPGKQFLFDAHILDALVRDRSGGAGQQALLDPDVGIAGSVGQPCPL